MDSTTLILQQNATTWAEGERFEVRRGKSITTVIPKLVSAVISSRVEVVTGTIGGGSHAESYLRSIGPYSIDHPGSCDLKSRDVEQIFRMKVRVEEFDDRRVEVTCLDMQPAEQVRLESASALQIVFFKGTPKIHGSIFAHKTGAGTAK